jgi:lipopolysaccharide/colanic/teichoic acid biosynthesis glycosyltransferase
MREAPILGSVPDLLRFWSISFGACFLAFSAFRLHQQLPEHFGVADALAIGKATICAEVLTSTALFFLTRLDGVPRSTLIIHALLTAVGLLTARMLIRIRQAPEGEAAPGNADAEHLVILGANRLAAAYIRFLDSIAPRQLKVVAVLDDSSELIGRSIAGRPIAGPVRHLAAIIDEFKVHGVRIDRVLVAGTQNMLSVACVQEVLSICRCERVELDFVPDLFCLGNRPQVIAERPAFVKPGFARASFALSFYFGLKRWIDVAISAALLLLLAPLFVFVSLLVFFDVGVPVVFWQRRLGRGGASFCLLKFRTLRAPYDAHGRAIPPEERLSAFGRLLRRTHLDELPQLLNVLVGDMSLIGPRPLLPRDQPADPSIRLMVRPGISGWAQVNGGTLLTAAEKDVLDEWYIRNASPWVDLRIVMMSFHAALIGQRRPARETREALTRRRRELTFSPKAAAARD